MTEWRTRAKRTKKAFQATGWTDVSLSLPSAAAQGAQLSWRGTFGGKTYEMAIVLAGADVWPKQGQAFFETIGTFVSGPRAEAA